MSSKPFCLPRVPSQVFKDISADEAVLVLFPGFEEAMGEAIAVLKDAGLAVHHVVWDKGYKGGNMGSRLNYSTEDILLGIKQPVSACALVRDGCGTFVVELWSHQKKLTTTVRCYLAHQQFGSTDMSCLAHVTVLVVM